MSGTIEIENLAFAREGKTVFDGLSLRLTERRIALVGRNGSGKSTLLRLIAGLLTPDAGSVRIDGSDPAKDRKAALDKVGILFQNPDHQIIFPTVGEEIAFGLEQQGRPKAGAREIVARTLAGAGHADWAERQCYTLSQGQRQMVCLLSILAMEPAWVLFDEPFSSLDIPSTLRIEARIGEMAPQAVLVTHDPARARGYDRVLWIEEGRIAADGTPGEVLPAYVAEMERLARLPETELPETLLPETRAPKC